MQISEFPFFIANPSLGIPYNLSVVHDAHLIQLRLAVGKSLIAAAAFLIIFVST